MNRILVIKHGALGDIVFSLPVMYAIRQNYPNSYIALLTEEKYFNFFNRSKYFDKLDKDNRSKNIFFNLSLLFKINKKKYNLIIDLQNSSRTTYYNLFFRLFSNTKINSSKQFANFRYIIPPQGDEITTKGLFNQIELLGITEYKNIEYPWLEENLNENTDMRKVLFIPGVSENGKYKQWDPIKFGELAKYCEHKKFQIYVVGNKRDYESIAPILNQCNNVVNYIGKSPPEIIYTLSNISTLIISNDTGPGHIAALTKRNILLLVNDNNITKANIGNAKNIFKLFSKNIKNISTEEVINFIEKKNLL